MADFSELGSDPKIVVSWLGKRGLNEGSRVLDLGCGKGTVSIEIPLRAS